LQIWNVQEQQYANYLKSQLNALVIAIGVTNIVTQGELLTIASSGTAAILTTSFGDLIGTLSLVGTAMCNSVKGTNNFQFLRLQFVLFVFYTRYILLTQHSFFFHSHPRDILIATTVFKNSFASVFSSISLNLILCYVAAVHRHHEMPKLFLLSLT
jgi:hypothetical protein